MDEYWKEIVQAGNIKGIKQMLEIAPNESKGMLSFGNKNSSKNLLNMAIYEYDYELVQLIFNYFDNSEIEFKFEIEMTEPPIKSLDINNQLKIFEYLFRKNKLNQSQKFILIKWSILSLNCPLVSGFMEEMDENDSIDSLVRALKTQYYSFRNKSGHLDMVRLVIDRTKLKDSIVKKESQKYLHWVVSEINFELAEYLILRYDLDITKSCIKMISNLNYYISEKNYKTHLKAFEWYLKSGAMVYWTNENGESIYKSTQNIRNIKFRNLFDGIINGILK